MDFLSLAKTTDAPPTTGSAVQLTKADRPAVWRDTPRTTMTGLVKTLCAKGIVQCLALMALCSCAGPGDSVAAQRLYKVMPQTVSVGVITPLDGINAQGRTLVTVSGTWQMRPFIPPANQTVKVER